MDGYSNVVEHGRGDMAEAYSAAVLSGGGGYVGDRQSYRAGLAEGLAHVDRGDLYKAADLLGAIERHVAAI